MDKIKHTVKMIIKEENTSISLIAEKLGISQSALSQQLINDSVKYRTAQQLAELLGYEIVWRKKE